ncbi:MAG: 50S ribosomal protein L15 [Oligoflexia bacterium]|nr:50S ribosomal protein L15 [Oligoflexia bacterium]
MRLGELRAARGAVKKNKRLGRGAGSGKGDTSGKGHKGLLARKGGGRRLGYEGGQTPMIRRIPKRGFHNFTKKNFALINLKQLESSGLKEVDLAALRKANILKGNETLLKVLGIGEITKAITVKAHQFSESAKAKLEKAGGKVEVIDVRG